VDRVFDLPGHSATFLLGGVGIWNVMMARVTSLNPGNRLEEAMGAEDRDILAQFRRRASCLSVGAALLEPENRPHHDGVLSYVIESRPPENLFLFGVSLAFLFAVLIGVGAGSILQSGPVAWKLYPPSVKISLFFQPGNGGLDSGDRLWQDL